MGSFTRIENISESAPVPPIDPDDEIFLICALDGSADWLVSEDSDLLDLKASYPRPQIGRCGGNHECSGYLNVSHPNRWVRSHDPGLISTAR